MLTGGWHHFGGAINSRENLSVTDGTISDNAAGRGGGGIYSFGGTATVTNSTISGNSASEGGGIHNTGTATVTNTIVAGNRNLNGDPSDIGGTDVVDIRYSPCRGEVKLTTQRARTRFRSTTRVTPFFLDEQRITGTTAVQLSVRYRVCIIVYSRLLDFTGARIVPRPLGEPGSCRPAATEGISRRRWPWW
jgi:hypothetical protein